MIKYAQKKLRTKSIPRITPEWTIIGGERWKKNSNFVPYAICINFIADYQNLATKDAQKKNSNEINSPEHPRMDDYTAVKGEKKF